MHKKLRILLVEDVASDAELILQEIRKSGFSFEHRLTDNSIDFRSLIREFRPDLILSDYSLPGFNGMEALRIRQEMVPFVPFILVTGSLNRDTAVELMKTGADDFVIKEHMSRLPSAINSVIEKKRILEAKNKAEEELKVLSRAVEQNPTSIMITDTKANIRYVNPKFTELTGYRAEEVLGKNPSILKSGHTSKLEYELMWKTITSGNEWKGEFENRKKNGELYTESALISPIFDNDGKTSYFVAVKEDVTEKNKMLSDLIAAKESAEAAEKDLILAKEKAEESDRLKTAFLHNISHEIRTPMNAIVGFSEFLNDPDLTPEKRKFFTGVIVQSSHQLLSIITNIINISTIESGQEKTNLKKVNINQICRHTYDHFLPSSKELNIGFAFETGLPDEEAFTTSDETKLFQVLSNLLENAFKFTTSGRVLFGYKAVKNDIEFFVQDTGIGIAADMHEEIFKRFRQVEFTAARQFGGSGLGLSISRAYVEMLGGKISVDSVPGKGSTFYFTIPRVPANLQPDHEIKYITGTKGLPNVLIAEDEESNFLLMKEMLEGIPVELHRATDGRKAVEICRQKEMHLVFMDIKMPFMDGCEATRQIKNIRPGLPVIALTAFILAEERKQALQSGFDGYITKPVKKSEIYRLLHQYLNLNIRV